MLSGFSEVIPEFFFDDGDDSQNCFIKFFQCHSLALFEVQSFYTGNFNFVISSLILNILSFFVNKINKATFQDYTFTYLFKHKK